MLPEPYVVTDRRGALAERSGGVPYGARSLDEVVGVAIHATTLDSSAATLARYQTIKVEGDPYPAMAYHFLVHPDGGVEWCQDLEVLTWHAGGEGSATHLAVCLAGAAEAPLPAVQEGAARALLDVLCLHVGRRLAVRPHHALVPAAAGCPGPGWRLWGASLTEA